MEYGSERTSVSPRFEGISFLISLYFPLYGEMDDIIGNRFRGVYC